MTSSTDEELRRYKAVLAEWNVTGAIEWKRIAAEELRCVLGGHSQRSIGQLMYEHRDEVVQTREVREGYRHSYKFHYDFRIPIDGRRIYIETKFDVGATVDDSKITVVRIKLA